MKIKSYAQSRAPMRRFIFHLSTSRTMSSPSSANIFGSSFEVWPHSSRWFLALGAISACTSVVFSAAFAHLPVFAGGMPPAVQTALSQQQFHSLGLLLTGLALRVCGRSRWLQAAGWLMVLGLLLFSFNLYARHVLGWDALRALVPWGGAAWIFAWLVLAMGLIQGGGKINRQT
jgi:uncharacterized membrane protein YgdD (TMEM256/DUF423 family)